MRITISTKARDLCPTLGWSLPVLFGRAELRGAMQLPTDEELEAVHAWLDDRLGLHEVPMVPCAPVRMR